MLLIFTKKLLRNVIIVLFPLLLPRYARSEIIFNYRNVGNLLDRVTNRNPANEKRTMKYFHRAPITWPIENYNFKFQLPESDLVDDVHLSTGRSL